MLNNPFRFGKIVYDQYFYDREEELGKVKNILSSGNNIALYAPRRYGKSSLIAKALGELQDEGFVCVHFDFMSVYSQKTFIENYSAAILKSQKKTNLQRFLSKFSSLIRNIKPSLSFDNDGNPEFSLAFLENASKEETLIDVINLPESLSGRNNKYIVAFDEFQELVKLNGENFEKLLRSQIQHHKNVSYVFLGSKTHLLKDMFNNKSRAFYHSAYVMNLRKIEKEKSIDFLIKTFDDSRMHLAQDIAEYLIDKVDNIPYYIQFLAHQIWESAMINQISEIDRSIVDSSMSSILELKDDYYWELTNRQSSHRKKLLLALSHDVKEIYSENTSRKYDLGTPSSTQKSVEVLINEGIIEKDKEKYEFSDPIYKQFVKNNL